MRRPLVFLGEIAHPSRATVLAVFSFFRRLLRRPGAEAPHAVSDPNVSRAGLMTRGARAGDTRHRPSQQDRDLAERLGTRAYDPTDRRL